MCTVCNDQLLLEPVMVSPLSTAVTHVPQRLHGKQHGACARLGGLDPGWDRRCAKPEVTSTGLVPTSSTAAPGLIHADLTISAFPTAATTMSARETMGAGSAVRECTTLTVASRRCSSMATGVPTMLLRPMTQALRPVIWIPERSRSSRQPCLGSRRQGSSAYK